MELEDRYVVLKLSRLSSTGIHNLDTYLEEYGFSHALVDCVVIEKDWPEYDPTVNLLWERINEL